MSSKAQSVYLGGQIIESPEKYPVFSYYMAFEHDRRYKRLFSQPYFLQKLLESFVAEDFITELDFSTLKRWDKSYVDSEFKEKESDLIFSIDYRNNPCCIFLLLEFQSTVDKLMPLRFLRYILEFYETNQSLMIDGSYPPVFPLLLYSGDAKWTAEFEISRLINPVIPLKYIPTFSYYPICENEIPESSLKRIKNAVSAVFFIENSDPQGLVYNIDELFRIIENENLEIVNEFSRWFYNYFDGLDQITGNDAVTRKFKNVLEGKTMFATKLEEYKKELLAEGRAEGLEKGLEKGREEGILESAKKLKTKGLTDQKISELLDLDIEEIKKL